MTASFTAASFKRSWNKMFWSSENMKRENNSNVLVMNMFQWKKWDRDVKKILSSQALRGGQPVRSRPGIPVLPVLPTKKTWEPDTGNEDRSILWENAKVMNQEGRVSVGCTVRFHRFNQAQVAGAPSLCVSKQSQNETWDSSHSLRTLRPRGPLLPFSPFGPGLPPGPWTVKRRDILG